jgi:hypothetical protein
MSNFSPDDRYVSPTYSEREIRALRIKQVHFLSEHVLFLLSDDKILCLPLALSADLAAASQEDRYQWQLIGVGRSVVWQTTTLNVHLSLRCLLEHPDAKVGDLAGAPSPMPPLRSN